MTPDELCEKLEGPEALACERRQLILERDRYKQALEEITKGCGRYSMDPFEHARNAIEDMKEIAAKALEVK